MAGGAQLATAATDEAIAAVIAMARAGYAAGQHSSRGNNLYRTNKNQARTRSIASTRPSQPRPKVAGQRPNNVYTDRNGSVYRDRGDGWDKRSQGEWKNHDLQKPEKRPANKPQSRPSEKPQQHPVTTPTQKPAQQPKQDYQRRDHGNDLNRSRDARSRGNQRTQSYNRSRGGGRRR